MGGVAIVWPKWVGDRLGTEVKTGGGGGVTMGVFQNPQLANTTTALLLTASGLVASGFLR